MLATLAEAAALLQRPDWLATAVKNGEFLINQLCTESGSTTIKRSWHQDGNPQAQHAALGADLAQLVDGFTRLAEATGQASWITHAKTIADKLLTNYWDAENGGIFTTAHDGEQLIVRQKDLMDNATPSANSTAAFALYRLAALTGEERYSQHADQISQLLSHRYKRTNCVRQFAQCCTPATARCSRSCNHRQSTRLGRATAQAVVAHRGECMGRAL